MNTHTPYVQAHADLITANQDAADEETRHAKAVEETNARKIDAKRRIALGDAGLALDRIEQARTVMYVSGYGRRGAEGNSAIRDAIACLVSGGAAMRCVFFGTKDYDRWSGQRCDCSYGMGPRHGSIVFRIGLHDEARERELTPSEIDSCVYYLNNVEAIESAKVLA